MEKFIQKLKDYTENRKSTVVRICGHGASGKTTFAKRLQKAYPAGRCQVIETDAYIISGEYSKDTFLQYELQDEIGFHPITACHPARHELASLRRDLIMLQKGMDCLTPDFPWSPEKILRADCPVTIVEGISPTFLEAEFFDLSLFFYTDADTELQRRLDRDTTHRGRQSDFILKTQAHRRRQYELYMEPYKEEFDMIINQSNNHFKLEKEEFPAIP